MSMMGLMWRSETQGVFCFTTCLSLRRGGGSGLERWHDDACQ